MGFFDSWKVKVHVFLKYQVLFPGNVVEGFVQIENSGHVDFVAIRVKACGKDKTYLKRNEGMDDDGNSIVRTYTQSSVVYKQLVTLAGQMKCTGSRQSQQLPPGTYTYPFQFQLPTTIPPSFAKRCGDGDMADIMYYVKAYVDIPMGRDAAVKQHFTVLNAMPAQQWVHRNPVTVDRQWHVTLCCCIDKGNVNGRLFMDRTVIAINRDNLLICADIDNSAGQEPVESLEISLINNLIYRAQGVEERNRVVAGRNFINQGVAAGQRGRIQGVIPIPRDIVPTVTSFNVTSTYLVQIELNIPMASDPSHQFPVILTHAVDDTNFLPPVTFEQCQYRPWNRNEPHEFYYQPPPQPVYAYQPAPCPPPPGVNMWAPPPPAFGIMPAQQGWSAPTAYQQNAPPPPMPLGQIQWNSGAPMSEMPMQQPPPPPPVVGTYGAQQQQQGPPPPQQNYQGERQQQPAAAGGNAQQPLLEDDV